MHCNDEMHSGATTKVATCTIVPPPPLKGIFVAPIRNRAATNGKGAGAIGSNRIVIREDSDRGEAPYGFFPRDDVMLVTVVRRSLIPSLSIGLSLRFVGASKAKTSNWHCVVYWCAFDDVLDDSHISRLSK